MIAQELADDNSGGETGEGDIGDEGTGDGDTGDAMKKKKKKPKKLIIDVTTHWNSTLDMLERYLELREAIALTLLTDSIQKNAGNLDTLSNSDLQDVTDMVELLKPLKKATTVMMDEKKPTVSLTSPLKHGIEIKMQPSEEDTSTVARMKRDILTNLSSRYTEELEYLVEYTALDTRFLNLPHLDEVHRRDVFRRLKEKALQFNQVFIYSYNNLYF
ncbi:Zinc finger BED domain-containing protein 1 [Xyrichtys novacula]|uniref:Zinc finger BED domain-containing protein 1 n=1 Tax=Xyrichtys novacula TaxID=13765 RepID=A0AAV1FKU5_XYRNO|nr:Zinc finger BED domain-containing protein 1 [Xyrichtys novacula]